MFHLHLYGRRTLHAGAKNAMITFIPSRVRCVCHLKIRNGNVRTTKNAYYSKVRRSRMIDTSWEVAACLYLPRTNYFVTALFARRYLLVFVFAWLLLSAHRFDSLFAVLAQLVYLRSTHNSTLSSLSSSIHNLLADSSLAPACSSLRLLKR